MYYPDYVKCAPIKDARTSSCFLHHNSQWNQINVSDTGTSPYLTYRVFTLSKKNLFRELINILTTIQSCGFGSSNILYLQYYKYVPPSTPAP